MYNTDLKLYTYCKRDFSPFVFVKVRVHDIDRIKELNMYVVEYDRNQLLGHEWINQLKVLENVKTSLENVVNIDAVSVSDHDKLADLLKKYQNLVSEEFLSIKGTEAQLKLKKNAKSVFIKSRMVLFKLQEKVKKN